MKLVAKQTNKQKPQNKKQERQTVLFMATTTHMDLEHLLACCLELHKRYIFIAEHIFTADKNPRTLTFSPLSSGYDAVYKQHSCALKGKGEVWLRP